MTGGGARRDRLGGIRPGATLDFRERRGRLVVAKSSPRIRSGRFAVVWRAEIRDRRLYGREPGRAAAFTAVDTNVLLDVFGADATNVASVAAEAWRRYRTRGDAARGSQANS